MAEEFDQILTATITIKRNGIHQTDPEYVAKNIRDLLEGLFDPLGEECEHNLDISADARKL